MDLKDITPELKEKALACKTHEELLALAKEEGYEITDEELQKLSAGGPSWNCSDYTCKDYTTPTCVAAWC